MQNKSVLQVVGLQVSCCNFLVIPVYCGIMESCIETILYTPKKFLPSENAHFRSLVFLAAVSTFYFMSILSDRAVGFWAHCSNHLSQRWKWRTVLAIEVSLSGVHSHGGFKSFANFWEAGSLWVSLVYFVSSSFVSDIRGCWIFPAENSKQVKSALV